MTPREVADLFTRLGVVRRGHFLLSGGWHSDTYVQCMLALQHPAVALRLGQALAERSRDLSPDLVASPALGGVVAGFATAAALQRRFVFAERDAEGVMRLRRGQTVGVGERVLVVEDVVTSGGSAAEVARLCRGAGATVTGIAALVDRSGGLPVAERPRPRPRALLSLSPQTWSVQDCPLCSQGRALDSPGSRHAAR